MSAYLADCNVNNWMQFWQENVNKFPKLYQLHLKHHCIPAKSAAMERCCSAAGYIVNARRSRLTDHLMLEHMLADFKVQQRKYGQVNAVLWYSLGLT